MKAWRGIEKQVGGRNPGKVPALPHDCEDADLRHLFAVPQPRALDCERRLEIISAYARVLERCSSSVEAESTLPFPKELIRQAIYDELTENPETELRGHLEIAFVQLESFLCAEEYEILFHFKVAASLAQELAKSGFPKDVICSARILQEVRGDRAVKIQEKISEEMWKRLEQIRATGSCTLPDSEYS